ncbi:lysosome membrane protein 2 [Planococcus citri]|uniref:lysosome membrane protein 2 n=1 Tax=Planococcus citri TaxID=170843 RepID=UPI0031FA202F
MTKSQYLKVGRSAKNRIFGSIAPIRRFSSVASPRHSNGTPIQMLVSEKFTISNSRLAVIVVGIFTLAIGIILSSIPWLDYIIMKNLKLLNGTLSYHYWHKPGVIRLTKVFIFNVTNPDGFLHNGEKPKLVEFGPFVYREDMEKVNTRFYDNGTTEFQHFKVLNFVPEMSIAGAEDLVFTVPNIPLLTLTTMANNLHWGIVWHGISGSLSWLRMEPFKKVNFHEFIWGYDSVITDVANRFLPKEKRPPQKMGIFLTRNGTLADTATIFNGEKGWENFGYMDRLNGLDHLPYWDPPCNSIAASEGSLFPPRSVTKSDIVHLYDKDLCRIWPMQYRYETTKKGIECGYYTPVDNIFSPEESENSTCFCGGLPCPPKGLQSISPCQFDAPLGISFPHFLNAAPELLNSVEGLSPDKEKHESFVKINSKLGVPLEARIRIQLNLMVEHSTMGVVRDFPTFNFPVMWLEEGVEELPDHLQILLYLSTTFADRIVPYITYGMAAFGGLILIVVFLRTYKNYIFTQQSIELGKRTLRRGSSFFTTGQQKLMMLRESYTLLNSPLAETETEQESST